MSRRVISFEDEPRWQEMYKLAKSCVERLVLPEKFRFCLERIGVKYKEAVSTNEENLVSVTLPAGWTLIDKRNQLNLKNEKGITEFEGYVYEKDDQFKWWYEEKQFEAK